MRPLSLAIIVLILVCIVIPVAAAGTDAVRVTGVARTSGLVHVTHNDVYAFGDQVHNTGRIAGHLLAAGRSVDLNGEVAGDFMAAGQEVTLSGTVLDDARMAGMNINVSGHVTDDVYAVGRQLSVTSRAFIGGDATLSGQSVHSAGTIQGDLTAKGGEVVLGGEVFGRVTVYAGKLTLLPGVKIRGDLHYAGSQPLVVPPGAAIKGGIFESRTPVVPQFDWNRLARWLLAVRILWHAGLLVVGLLWLWLLPRTLVTAASLVGGWFGIGIITGLIALLAVPLLAGLLMITVVGIPLGLILLCVYGILLYLSFVPVALWVGRKLVRSEERDGAAMVLGNILLALLMFIPWAGPVLGFLAMSAGLGALVRTQFRVMRYMRGAGIIS